MKGVVASGHHLTSQAASDMLSLGGNAFDAAVSAGFASVVAEPTLTSLGGGGFLLAHRESSHEDILFDFFVNTPGLNGNRSVAPEMTPVGIEFPQCTQVFHTGLASSAVPGMLKGLLHVHRRLCTLPLETIVAPALAFLEQGVEICPTQETIIGYLEPIFNSTAYGKELFWKDNRYVKQGDRLFNPLLREFLHNLCVSGRDIYKGETALTIAEEMLQQGGMITAEDLAAYEVIERTPLRIPYRNREVLTNPPPSSGGIMIALALALLERLDLKSLPRDSDTFYITIIELMKSMNTFRPGQQGNKDTPYPFSEELLSPILESYRHELSTRTFIATEGTTHISVVDGEGNAASMTTSNGTGSGCFIPGTGIMLNNMMGEDDLHPGGFFSSPPALRVSSMMVPTLVVREEKVECALGSGGSKRIRSAILQVLLNIIDFAFPLREAVEKSRVHIEDGIVQAEPGIPLHIIESLEKYYRLSSWSEKNMYFGGVHCAGSSMDAWGDSRRGGSFRIVP
jgi:gamma-glutamyltranspeptidase/glutathione hydrolase